MAHIEHNHLAAFADKRVNLKRDDVTAYRNQVANLRNKLESHIKVNPGFDLFKMLASGSLAKGTALSTLNDIDVAVYVKKSEVPSHEADLIAWVSSRLREAYSNLNYDQFKENAHSITISFRGSGLDVDVVPILYVGDNDDKGLDCTPRAGESLQEVLV